MSLIQKWEKGDSSPSLSHSVCIMGSQGPVSLKCLKPRGGEEVTLDSGALPP